MGQLSVHKTGNAFQIWKSVSLDMLRAYDGQFKTIYLHRLATVLSKLADKKITSAFFSVKEYSQDQQHKQDHEEQQRLLAVYRAARKKIELQAKLVVEAVEAFVDELQEQKTE